MNTVYYVVQKELEENGGIEETTGNKSIYLYQIENNKPNLLGVVETTNDTETLTVAREAIDNMGDKFLSNEIIKFVEL